jgi:serine/threonine protein kinase
MDYYPNGTLHDIINAYMANGKRLDENIALYYTVELLRIVESLHSCGTKLFKVKFSKSRNHSWGYQTRQFISCQWNWRLGTRSRYLETLGKLFLIILSLIYLIGFTETDRFWKECRYYTLSSWHFILWRLSCRCFSLC